MATETSIKSCVRDIIYFIMEDVTTEESLEKVSNKMINNITQQLLLLSVKGKLEGGEIVLMMRSNMHLKLFAVIYFYL